MPGLFSRRRGSSAQPPLNRSTASAAATAATQAYVNRSSNTAALSSAAAAAALRTHTTTPEPVGSIVTKRMVRRGSTSSNGSHQPVSTTSARGGLQRTNSSGSMTERTFRSASPSPSRGNGTISPAVHHPPMPPLPKTLRNGPPKRPGSTEPPARVMSPTMPRTMRSASVDIPSQHRFFGHKNSKPLANVPEVSTATSRAAPQGDRSSVNFSRPRMSSPEPTPISSTSQTNKNVHTAGGWFSGPVGSASPTTSDQKKPAALRLADQNANEMEEVMVYNAGTRTFVKSLRPKPKAEPPSPVIDDAPALKPGDFDPATRRIVPLPISRTTSSEKVPSAPTSPAVNKSTTNPLDSTQPSAVKQSIDRPVTSRPTALHKQPSMVREDPDAERAAEQSASTTATPAATKSLSTGPSSGSQHKRIVSLDVPRGPGDYSRGGSLSPSRSAHFSASPIVRNLMHEPPERGISPAKSALKHSPSSSVRAVSPIATFSPTPALQSGASDMSDATSQTSADGSTAGSRKKKSVRVSWDEAALVPPVPEITKTPTASKPIRGADTASDDDDAEDYSKPRPVLPSFGSVRKDRSPSARTEERAESQPMSTTTSSTKASIANPTASNDPLPPEVTSKETAEPNLDLDNSEGEVPVAVHKTTLAPTAVAEPEKSAVQVAESTPIASKEVVPAINLDPPTPGLDEKTPELTTDDETNGMTESQELRTLAHGIVRYGDESDSSVAPTTPAAAAPKIIRKDSDNDVYSDAPESQDAGQPGFASLDAIVESPVASPVKATASDEIPVTQPEGSKATLPPTTHATTASGENDKPVDWTAASAHWSQHKAQAQQTQLSSGDEKKSKMSFFKRNKKKDPKKEDARAQSPDPTPLAVVPVTTAPPERAASPVSTPTKSTPNAAAHPLKSAMKSAATEPPADGSVRLPKTMRDPDAHVKSNTQGPKINGTRPASMSQQSPAGRAETGPKRLSHAGNLQSHTAPSSKLVKNVRDESDSDSSFKKKRRPGSTNSASGRYSMRRSMRGSVDSTTRVASPPPNAGRSMSPLSDSGREGRATSLRQSLRSSGAPTRSLRASNATPTKSKVAPVLSSRFKSRFVDSDDSEDDAPARSRPVYRSRFYDSDEDDTIAEELTPVRGIPRRKGQEDGDSTDLDEEADGHSSKQKSHNVQAITADPAEVDKVMELARKRLGLDRTPTDRSQHPGKSAIRSNGRNRDEDKVLIPNDVMSDAGSEATTRSRTRGFMRGLLGRNRASSNSTRRVESPPPPMPVFASPDGTPQKAAAHTTAGSPSAAKLVRRPSQPPLQRGNSNFSTATAPATSASRPTDNENWPLPPPIPQSKSDAINGRDTDRPQTSDDSMHSNRAAERPQNRRSFSARVGFTDEAIAHSEKDDSERGEEGNAVYSQRTGRKKKFALLRRAFGLYD